MPIVFQPKPLSFDPFLSEPEISPLDWDNVTDRYAALTADQSHVHKYSSLAEMISRRICSKHNKNAILSLFGEPGGGKSWAALSLADGVAKWNAKFLGGSPEDYFTLENVAIIHPEMLRQLIKGMKRHNIYILDDAGAAYDARNYMKQDNKALGYVLQTFRTLNALLIVTGVDGAMLDVNLHRTARYYAEISNPRHTLGYTDVAVFRTMRKFRTKETHYRYLSQAKSKIRGYRVFAPPDSLVKPYEQIRRDQVEWVLTMEGDKKEAEKPQKKGPYLSCQICGHGWCYTGRSKRKATCPACGGKVSVSGLPTTTVCA